MSGGAGVTRVRQWQVYVYELDDAAGPGRVAGKPNLYVGETERTVLERLGAHLTNKLTGSRKVRKHFRAIRFDLFEGWGPYETESDALRAEGDLARSLREAGFAVVNKTGSPVRFPGRASAAGGGEPRRRAA